MSSNTLMPTSINTSPSFKFKIFMDHSLGSGSGSGSGSSAYSRTLCFLISKKWSSLSSWYWYFSYSKTPQHRTARTCALVSIYIYMNSIFLFSHLGKIWNKRFAHSAFPWKSVLIDTSSRNGWTCRVVRVLPHTKSANTTCKTLLMMDRWGPKHVELT